MDQQTAYKLLSAELDAYRALSFSDLRDAVGRSHEHRVTGQDGRDYVIVVRVLPAQNCTDIVIAGEIDDVSGVRLRRLQRTVAVTEPGG